jgi:hypothetical protein
MNYCNILVYIQSLQYKIIGKSQLDREGLGIVSDGLLVYQFNNDYGFYFYKDGWHKIGGGGSAWTETTDEVHTTKNVGIGTNIPVTNLHIDGTSWNMLYLLRFWL